MRSCGSRAFPSSHPSGIERPAAARRRRSCRRFPHRRRPRRLKGILPDRMIAALADAGGIRPAARFRSRPDPAGQPRPAARRDRLPRARELPARPANHRRRAYRRAQAARVRAHRRRGAGNQLRLHRAAAGKPRAARRHRGRRQPEKLDRAARRVHARDRRRHARLRPDRRRLSRAALCRDQPADLSGAGARRLAAVADPLPPRPRAARCARRCERCTTRERLTDDAEADVSDGIAVGVDLAGLGPDGLRRLSRQAPHRPDRRREARWPRVADFWEPIAARADKS